MRHPFRKTSTRVAMAALLPLSVFMQIAHADPALQPGATLDRADAHGIEALGASRCLSVGLARPRGFAASALPTATLRNHCDYPVVVSYCVVDADHGPRACSSVDKAPAVIRRIDANSVLSLDAADSSTLHSAISWAACRALPGVASGLRDEGTRGYCSAPPPVMQALAQRAP